MNSLTFRVTAPFQINNKWEWKTWTTTMANKILAIDTKGRELGATRWDYGQADHAEVR
jgi:hypothetical protein